MMIVSHRTMPHLGGERNDAMRTYAKRLLGLLLAMALLLSACAGWDPEAMLAQLGMGHAVTRYEDMVYTRPDMARLEQTRDAVRESAKGEDLEDILDSLYAFYDEYDWFYTNYSLANIKYSTDLTDIYWKQEYEFCVEKGPSADAALEEVYMALARSPCREELESDRYFGPGFFDSYEGENVWDQAFMARKEREAALQSRYYALSKQALGYEYGSEAYYSACGTEMGELLVEMIRLRQETAASVGYSDYVQFAYDFYYCRDFTPGQVEEYLDTLQQELVPVYRDLAESGVWDRYYDYCTEAQTMSFLKKATKNMGGVVEDAFGFLEKGRLYDISYGENKYNSSFEVYLTGYQSPFIFMNSNADSYDKLTLAHEFGHFCADYACYGSYAGVDVAEFFSQGMEYLSLCYGEDVKSLTELKMAGSLCTYVEQSAYAAFEQRMYGLSGDELTVEALCALYEEIIREFGLDAYGYDRREFVTITHFYTNPLYIISYVVSNDGAMQLYQLEQEEPGAGLELYENSLTTGDGYFLEFLEGAGLESPFAEGRLAEARRTFEAVLG